MLASIVLFAGCNKEEDEQPLSDADRIAVEAAAADYLLAQAACENAFKIVDTEAKKQSNLNGLHDNAPEVEIRNDCPGVDLTLGGNSVFPATLTLDFNEGCQPENGVILAGKIVAVYNGLLLSPGTSYELTFENFVYNGNAIQGTYFLSNDGQDNNGQWMFSATVDGIVTTADGRTIDYEATHSSRQVEGYDTNFFTDGLSGILDDVWSGTREARLTTSGGVDLSVTTPSPIRNPLICRWPVSGNFELSFNTLGLTGSIDFGDDQCDNKAQLTVGDFSRELELR